MGLEPMTPRLKSSALPTELMEHKNTANLEEIYSS